MVFGWMYLEQILTENPTINLLLTCDTGISAHEAVAFANKNGIDVVITDHHELPECVAPSVRNNQSKATRSKTSIGNIARGRCCLQAG